MTKKVIENVSMVNGEKNRKTWSDLPALIVWMIKDRLDLPTNLRFVVVCKSWQQASLAYYPINCYQSTRDAQAPPWIMITRDIGESKRDFISMSTGEKYTIDLPDFRKTIVLYSKQGWLLLVKMKPMNKYLSKQFIVDHDSDITDCPFFLLNPFTKVKITLPLIPCMSEPYGAFTVVDGNPQLVVLASAALFNRGAFNWVNLWTIHVGVDKGWRSHSSTWQFSRRVDMIPRVVIVRQVVYCFNENSEVFVFDMLNSQFQDPMKKAAEFLSKSRFCVMENGGEIYKVSLDDKNNGEGVPMFYRLKTESNSTDSDWELLNSEELKDEHWYLISRPEYQCFVLKETGPCQIYRNQMGVVGCNEYFKVHFFEGNEVKKVLPKPNVIIKDWVDMG